MNWIIMAMIIATAPNAVSLIAIIMQPTKDENESDNDEQNKEYKNGKEKQSNIDKNKDNER